MTNNLIINLINMLDQCVMIDQNIIILEKYKNHYYITKPTTNARFFFVGKSIINSTFPNQGNIFGYPLSDNILKFSYNYCLKKKNESPFILRHNFKIFNYYNIDLTKNSLNSNINYYLIDNKNNVEAKNNQNNSDKSITLELKDDFSTSNESLNSKTIINNDIVLGEQQVIIPEDPHTQEGDVQKKKLEDLNTASSSSESSNSNFTNNQEEANVENNVIPSPTYTTTIDKSNESSIIVEDENKVVEANNQNNSRPPPIPNSLTTNTASSSSNDSSSSNSSSSNDYSNIIDNEEKIIKFNNTIIKVKNNIITEVNGKVFNRSIISDEELKFYFDHGHNKNIFLFSFYYNLNTENYYPIYKKSFFLLSENFKEEFKILITFFDRKKFTLNENIINWFIKNKIENEKLTLYEVMQNLEINNKKGKFESSNTEEYYNDYNIASRMMVVNCDPKGDLSIFYESIDKFHLLNQLIEAFECTIRKDE